MLIEEQLTEQIIGAAIEVHKELGAGLLESSYRVCLCHELGRRGLKYRTEVPLPIVYKGIQLDCGYRMDIIMEDKILRELKTVEKIIPVHEAQLLTYLKLSGLKVGLIINFYSPVLRNSIRRMAL